MTSKVVKGFPRSDSVRQREHSLTYITYFLSTCTFIFQDTTGTTFIEVKRGLLWKTPYENLSQVEPRARQA